MIADVYVCDIQYHPAGFLIIATSGSPGTGKLILQAADQRAWETAITLGASRFQAMLTLMYEVRFGLIATLTIVTLFAFIVLRGFYRLFSEHNVFVTLAGFGLLVQFGLQALINMGSTLNLIPTKGMTLPFMSYGGSSLLAMSFGMGMLLALTRRRVGEAE